MADDLLHYFRNAGVERPTRDIMVNRTHLWKRTFLVLVIGIVLGCASQLGGGRPDFQLWDESGEPLNLLPPIPRLHLSGLNKIPISDIWWIEGDVSSTSSERLRAGEVPDSVERKRLGLSVWTVDADEVVLAPSVPLLPGERYTLVALGVGRLVELRAAEVDIQQMWRRWGSGSITLGMKLIYCQFDTFPTISAEESPTSDADFGEGGSGSGDMAEIDGIEWGLAPDLLEDQCLRVQPNFGDRTFYVPPPQVEDVFLDPQPVAVEDHFSEEPLDPAGVSPPASGYQGDCATLGESVICADGPSLVVHSSGLALALELFLEHRRIGLIAVDSRAAEPTVFGPVLPHREYSFLALTFSPQFPEQGQLWSGSIVSQAAAPHLVITELMPNPVGPEPEGEWIEIFNAGTESASLKGLEIWDDSGGVALPEGEIPPGEFGLIVRPDFVLGQQVPDQRALPIYVSALGKNGLRNSGEPVQLRSDDGTILSSVPEITTPEGISLARLSPWAPDVASSFSTQDEAFATPGSANEF